MQMPAVTWNNGLQLRGDPFETEAGIDLFSEPPIVIDFIVSKNNQQPPTKQCRFNRVRALSLLESMLFLENPANRFYIG